jgi:CubicO group peptidase (beta-lactamase class C family)
MSKSYSTPWSALSWLDLAFFLVAHLKWRGCRRHLKRGVIVRRYSLGSLIAALFLAVTAAGQSPLSVPKDFDLEAIDRYVAAYVKEKGLVGLSVAIMRDGEIVHAKGYGQRSLEPPRPVEAATSFAGGSITKQFACACVLLLAEEGKLSAHDAVGKWFPGLTRASDVTLLDLMNHTSGYPDYYPLDFVDRRMLRPITLDGLLKEYAGGKLDFEPGSRFSYSNTGYIALGGVVEKVSGEKFGDFLERRILRPLKLEHARFGSAEGLESPATGYNGFALSPPEPAGPEASGWIEAAGGLWASATDLLKWDLALTGGEVLEARSYDLMTAPRKLSSGKISNYGCGLGIEVRGGELVLQHTGGVSGFVSYNAFVPRTRSGLVVLSNTEHISATPLRTELFNLLLEDIARRDAPEVPQVHGPNAKQVVADFFKQLQAGRVDRSLLGEEFSGYLTDERIKSASERLQALGEPQEVEAGASSERGGMEVTRVTLTFKSAKLRGSLYRSPDGKIEQLLFYGE